MTKIFFGNVFSDMSSGSVSIVKQAAMTKLSLRTLILKQSTRIASVKQNGQPRENAIRTFHDHAK